MPGRVHLFVSATPDLEPEREIVGQVVARLPVSIGWEIKRTPRRGEPLQPALEAATACDLYLFLLGRDIAAPAGVEWDVAWRAGKKPLAYAKDVLHTPAAEAFVRDAGVTWTRFASDEELMDVVRIALAKHLTERALRYRLSVVEHEALSALLQKIKVEKPPAEAPPIGGKSGGAAGGGVILGPGDLPPGGVPVTADDSWPLPATPAERLEQGVRRAEWSCDTPSSQVEDKPVPRRRERPPR